MLLHLPAMPVSIRTRRINCVLSLSRDCGGAQGVCEGQSSIMYAWGRNAPSTKLPRGIHSLFLSEPFQTLTFSYVAEIKIEIIKISRTHPSA